MNLNGNQYQKLCRLSDEVLLDPDATPARIAIPWLDAIREHPVFLENYECLVLTDKYIVDLINNSFRSFRNKLSLLKTVVKSVFLPDSSAWLRIIDQLSGIDVLFISHLLNREQFNDKDDFYYSDLPRRLNQDNYSSLIAMLNHTGILSTHSSGSQNKEKSVPHT